MLKPFLFVVQVFFNYLLRKCDFKVRVLKSPCIASTHACLCKSVHVSASLCMCVCLCATCFCATPARFYCRQQQQQGALSARSNRYVNMRVHFAPPRRLAGVDCINLEANTPKNNHNNTRRQRQQQAAVYCSGMRCAVACNMFLYKSITCQT